MTQAPILPLQKLVTYDEFIAWYPQNSVLKYELHSGVIIEMPPPSGDHEEVLGFLIDEIAAQCRQSNLSYFIPKLGLVRTPSANSAYMPDILVLNRNNLKHEPLWKKESTVIYPESIPLVVEIVSTNWQDDYEKKFNDYEAMGIREYWIIDFGAFGGRKYIGKPKIPTIFVCELNDGEYQMAPFRDSDRIISAAFPQLNLTAQQVFGSII
jgi:Uma2 family endonuclease